MSWFRLFEGVQPLVGNLGAAHAEELESGQPFELLQARVGDLRAADHQSAKALEAARAASPRSVIWSLVT